MKNIFALPGILLPLTILVIGAFIGNSALDIKMHETYYYPFNPTQIKFDIPIFISWIFHIILGCAKQPTKIWAWLQVTISIVCLLIMYFLLDNPMPRRYYEYNTGWINNFFNNRNVMCLLSVIEFYLTQIAFWLYGVIALVKRNNPKTIG